MKVIEANAYRSYSLKVPKMDYRGEERYRPNEDSTIHSGLRATIEDSDDVAECQRRLDALCEDLVEAAKQRALADVREALQPTSPPPSKETLAELAKLRAQLAELSGEPVQREPTPTEADAQRLLKQLRIAVFDLRRRS